MAGTKVKVVNSGLAGGLWFGGWLFTLGFLKLTFFQGVLGLLIWPYYLGAHLGMPVEAIVK